MHPLDDAQSFMKASPPPIPFDQPCLVALHFLSARHPTPQRFALDEIVTAHEAVERGQVTGKALIELAC